jgi:hypothetical protein
MIASEKKTPPKRARVTTAIAHHAHRSRRASGPTAIAKASADAPG